MTGGGGEYRIEDGRLTVLSRGIYPVEEYMAAVEAGLADPACPDRVGLLSDSGDLDVIRSPLDMRRLAEFLVERQDRITAVAVVVSLDAQFGLTRMAAAAAESKGLSLGAFRTREEALDWLSEQTAS